MRNTTRKIIQADNGGWIIQDHKEYEQPVFVAAFSTFKELAQYIEPSCYRAPTDAVTAAKTVAEIYGNVAYNKIKMIKLIRNLSGDGLREAKDAVEAVFVFKPTTFDTVTDWANAE